MDDLISRAAVLDAIDNERKLLIERKQYGAEHIIVHHARRMIEEFPAVDAVLVVRCKDCKCWHRDDPVGKACECYLNGGWWLPEDYCSCGERRDEDVKDD